MFKQLGVCANSFKMSQAAKSSTKKGTGQSRLFDLFQKERNETAESILEFDFKKKRVKLLTDESNVKENSNGILYWMFRDQRLEDNWALLHAQKLALKNQVPLHVCFCLLPKYLDANMRHYQFLAKGLEEVAADCAKLNINFHLFFGFGSDEVPKFVKKHGMGAVICDFCPLRLPLKWMNEMVKNLPANIPVCQVDSHNIVPIWVTSDKQEYAARTIRNKVNSKLEEFLTEFPPVMVHPHDAVVKVPKIDWTNIWKHVEIDDVEEVTWAVPGYRGGLQMLEEFCDRRLKGYSTKRNDPTLDGLSNLSPWYHFGTFTTTFSEYLDNKMRP